MKFKDVRTIDSILIEYGLKPGAPTPVGNQQSGEVAKTTPQKSTTPPKKDLGSPTVTQGLDIPEPEAPEPQAFKAMDLGDGDEFKDKTGKVVGKVVSKVGDGPQPDKLVVDDGKGEYSFIEPEDEVFIDAPVTETEGKYSKKVHRDAKAKLSKSDSKKNSIKKRIKRLVRSQLSEADEKLFEINFNNPQVAKNSLDLPVRCGFEAETLWENVSSGSGADVDDMSYGEIEEAIYLGSDADYILEGFSEWIRENKTDEFLEDLVEEKVDEVKEDEDWLNDFIDSSDGPSSEAVEVYKNEFEEENPTEYQNREEDGWEYLNWVREYVEEEYDEIYLDWLRDAVVEEYDLQSDAFDQAYDEYTVDDWISSEFYSMSSMLDDYGIDYSELGNSGLDDIANTMFEGWIDQVSQFKDYPETGQYGDTSTSSWAVETDSSIDGSGTGAEIISPVYDTPRQMLEEMKSLFEFFEENSVYTNRSTGLHVTMSWNGDNMGPRDEAGALPGPNKVKMAALLGDNYLLRTFGREGNSYAKEQSANLRKVATKLRKAASSGKEGFGEIEKTMDNAISGDKFASIHFKSLKDRESGTNLIEFRIGGGEDYHNDMAKVVKAVVRYATIMEAGYNDDKYTQDYANALYKLVDKASKVDPKDLERIKDSSADEIDEPLLNLYKDMIGKENFVEGVQDLARAYSTLKEYHKLSQPDADEKWKQQIKDYEKGTGQSVILDEVETMEPVRAYARPKSSPPSKRAPINLEKAQELYLTSMTMLAVDVAENKHRLDVNAKAIGILRSGIKQFYLDSDTFSNKVLQYSRRVNIPTQNDRSDQRAVIIKKGMDKLFKKEIFIAPTFLNLPQSEKIIKGMWNAIHSKGWGREESEKLIDLLLKVNYGPDIPSTDNAHNMKTTILNSFDIRQFNEFYRHLSHGGYNSVSPPAQPGEQYYKDEYNELINFTNNFAEYNEPVAQTFNSNLFSDESYIENFLSTYTMKMKKRLKHLVEIKDEQPQLYLDTMPVLGSACIKLTKALKQVELSNFVDENYPEVEDSTKFLGASNYSLEYLEEIIEDFKNKTYVDPMRGNIVSRLDDRMSEVIRTGLGDYYKSKETRPEVYKVPEVEKLIKKRFTALKNWMTTIDKIGQKIGFDSQADEIADKNDIESRKKNFKQTISKKPEVTLNIPGSAISFIRNDLYNDLVNSDSVDARLSTLVQNKKYFTTSLNKHRSRVYVIPAAHWSQASSAVLIQRDDNPQPSWRLESARKVLKQFYANYGISYSELTNNGDSNDRDEFTPLNDTDNQKPLKKLGIKITREGDSREPHVQPLVPHSQTAQQDVGTPMELSAAAAWHVNNPKLSKKARASDKETLVSSDISIKHAAEVTEFDGESSGTISSNTNWERLAVRLGIEPGVNNQGVNLLIKVVDTFNSDHTRYRMEDDRPIVGMTRWLRCIHDAHEYIKKNYKEGGGNYFRKNADGSDGDDVSSMYTNTDNRSSDYDKARADHPSFDTMMQRGMQNYLPRDQVNDLVGFLNNTDNDNVFKSKVLGTIMTRAELENGPFATFQDALAVTRRQGNESVFAKFDALPLQEQIRIIEQSEILNEIDWKKVKKGVAGAALAGTLATAPMDAKADTVSVDPQLDQPVATQQLNVDDYNNKADKSFKLDKDIWLNRYRLKDYGIDDWYSFQTGDNIFAPGLSVEQMLPYVKKIHNSRPDFLGKPTSKFKITTSDHNKSDAMGVVEYENGKLEIHLVPGGKIKSALPIGKVIDGHRVGSDKKYIMTFINWHTDKNATPTEFSLDESVPTIKTIKILNDLLADHFPVGDLKKQMLAFQAIPIPAMLDQFRELRAEAGDDACARGIVRYYVNALPKEQQDKIDLREWSKNKIDSLIESKGIMGRVLGDRFQKGDDVLEFQSVNLYPTEEMEFDSPEQRDEFIQQLEQELGSQIEWTNVPNRGSLSFGVAVFTDPALDDKLTYWGRYFRQKTADMMGKWSNSQVPQGWKLQTAGAMKLDIGIDPQHLIKTDDPFNGVLDVIQAVKTNSAGNELSESLVNALETIHTQEHPVFPGQISNLPALRDYFGEIMGPVALMSEMVGGQADAAKADLLKGLSWSECSIFWPMAMNAPLVDSYFTAPDGTRVGISSKGGKGAKASVKNIQDAILKAPDVMKSQYQTTVKVVDIVQSNSAKDGPFRLAELYRILPQGLEEEINGYIQTGKQDYAGLSPACTELFNYGTPRQDVPGFNTGYAMLALLAKKVTRTINSSGPEFGQGCVAFLNQSSIVQLYCKMGKMGDDARVTGWEAVYPPNFQGTVEIDGSKNYYSSRIGGKFAFGFK